MRAMACGTKGNTILRAIYTLVGHKAFLSELNSPRLRFVVVIDI